MRIIGLVGNERTSLIPSNFYLPDSSRQQRVVSLVLSLLVAAAVVETKKFGGDKILKGILIRGFQIWPSSLFIIEPDNIWKKEDKEESSSFFHFCQNKQTKR